MQTVLREPDIISYDAKEIVAYMKKVNANCLVLNAGGVIDFFDYPFDMANPNQFMTKDILHETSQAIREAGLRIIVRVDFRGVEKKRYEQHPDWFSCDEFGNPRLATYRGAGIYQPCYHSRYTNEHAEQFIDYLLTTYDIDGIWQNSLGFDWGPCYCKSCRASYELEVGGQIPKIPAGADFFETLATPEFADFNAWKIKSADFHIERMRKATKKHGDEKAYCAEIFDLYSDHFAKATGISHVNAKKSFDFIVSCVFMSASHSSVENRVYDIISNAATTTRFSRALAPDKQPVIITGGNGTRWRYISDSALETRMWLWEIASVGGGIWNCYFNGQNPAKTYDRRNAYSEQPVYNYLTNNSDRLSWSTPVMDVGIYYCATTQERYCSADEKIDQFGIHIKGIERVLLEEHIQYGFLPSFEFSAAKLEGVKAILIPNGAFISDQDIEVIRDYVYNGGGLIASFETSLYDESGKPRDDFGMKDLFGVSYTGIKLDTSEDTYQWVVEKNNPVLKTVDDTDMLMTGGQTLLVKSEGADVVTTRVPFIPNQPPEYAWVTEMKTEYPVITTHSYGKGKVVYFANTLDALCFTNGHEDFTAIYKNAIDYVVSDYKITVDAPRSVHVNLLENREKVGQFVLALVNTTGTSQRPLKEVVTIADIVIKMPLETGPLKYWETLWGESFEVTLTDDEVHIHLKKLEEFASIELLFEVK